MTVPGKNGHWEAPDSYYYLGRFLQDWLEVRKRKFTSQQDWEAAQQELMVYYFGSIEEDGLLQIDMNHSLNGILDDLQADYPRFTRRRILLFSYVAARLPLELYWPWTGCPCKEAASVMHTFMKKDIEARNPPRKAEYLALLER